MAAMENSERVKKVGEIMPARYVCKYCGYILYEFNKVGWENAHGMKTPSEIISAYGGKCPKCGHDLSKPSVEDVIITLKRHK